MSPFWILLELRMMEPVVTTGTIRRAKLQSNRHHQQTNAQLFTGWMPFLSPNQQCQSTEGKLHTILLLQVFVNQPIVPQISLQARSGLHRSHNWNYWCEILDSLQARRPCRHSTGSHPSCNA